jgi:hypothetical protein
MLKSPKKLDNLEIAVAERYQDIESVGLKYFNLTNKDLELD